MRLLIILSLAFLYCASSETTFAGNGIQGIRNRAENLKKKVQGTATKIKAKAQKTKKKRVRIRMTPDSMDAPMILLYPDDAPGAKGDTDLDKPAIFAYLPEKEKQTGAAIVIYPGGGYGGLAMDHEGKQIAQWMNKLGITAFVTRYRLGRTYGHPVPLQDAQRALRYVRAHAEKWNIEKNRVGIIGFSAGGHLASTVGTHFDSGLEADEDPINKESSKPDFMILGYPVISMQDGVTHAGSKRNLLGTEPDPKLVELLSNELQVKKDTPPTFIFQTNEDTAVKAENCLLFTMALRKAGVPVELHMYERGRHGVGMGAGIFGTSSWTGRLEDWLQHRKFAKKE